MAKSITVKIRFLEEILGSLPSSKEIYSRFVATKAPSTEMADDEVEGFESPVDEKGLTVFYRRDGKPVLLDYQVKGFLKAAWQALSKINGTKSSKIKAGLSKIDRTAHIYPRYIPISEDISEDNLERPLRANTAQGPRVTLASSEQIPAGAEMSFEIRLLDESLEDACREWLAFGQYSGLGQWRNSGKGRFEVIDYQVHENLLFPELGY